MNRTSFLLAATIPAMVGSSNAFAQSGTSAGPAPQNAATQTQIEDIVVTAQRRSENLQNVPISITAVTAAKIKDLGVQTTADVTLISPGLQFQQGLGQASPFIRGIGSQSLGAGFESSVATYIDGVYIASGTGSIMSLNNIERVEVLKGPQGTLFGRNTTGGMINVITRDPTFTPTLEGSVSYDQYDTITPSAYVSLPVTDTVAFDVAARYSYQGQGWGTNRPTGRDVQKVNHDFAVRSKLLIEPSDDTKLILSGDYSNVDSSTYVVLTPVPGSALINGEQLTGRPWDNNSTLSDPKRHVKAWGFGADFTYDFDFATLRSISSIRKTDGYLLVDPTGTQTPFFNISSRQIEKQVSQEFQLLSPGGSRIKWIVGLYYFRNDAKAANNDIILFPAATGFPGPVTLSKYARQVVRSMAAFGQVTVPVTDQFNLTGGLRYTRDKYHAENVTGNILSFAPSPPPTVFPDRRLSQSKPSWRLAADYHVTPDALLYATYNRGFRSGGFNILEETSAPLRPEIVDAFEAGTKIDALNRALRFNVAAYYIKAKDLQLTRLNGAGGQDTVNAGESESYGIELEAALIPVTGLTLSASGTILHSEYTVFKDAPITTRLPGGGISQVSGDATGNDTPRQPNKTITLSASYETPFANGQLKLAGTYFWSAKWYSDPDNTLFQPSYNLVSGQVSWTEPSGHVTLRFFGRNLTNAKVVTQFARLAPLGDVQMLSEPRTIGGAIDFKF
ncbi:MAG: TonB-dependent receptor [Sphingobium sp.]